MVAIDPGSDVSGFAVFNAGKLRYHAEGKPTYGFVKTCLEQAVLHAEGSHIVVVAEKWTAGGKFMTPTVAAGLGASWGGWRIMIEGLLDLPPRKTVRVYPQTWRAAIFRRSGGLSKEAWKRTSKGYVHARMGLTVGDDAADAICMGLWGCHAGEVGAALPVALRRSGLAQGELFSVRNR